MRLVDELDDDEALAGLPDEEQLALAGIAEAAREGLLALSVTAGMAVLEGVDGRPPEMPTWTPDELRLFLEAVER